MRRRSHSLFRSRSSIPVAVFDAGEIAEYLEVRYANGSERYESFGGEVESPESGEVIFADAASRAHARRWTNRQSAYSAVRPSTSTVVIVAEAMHDTARPDVERLMHTLAGELQVIWSVDARSALLTSASPGFEL
jgi:DNA/RNA-binding domain of Phe-tRNA-synthetase-like protein